MDILSLSGVIFLFLLLSIFLQRDNLELRGISKATSKTSPYFFGIFSIFWLGFLLFFILKSSFAVRDLLLIVNFFLLIFLSSAWFSLKRPLLTRIIIFTFSFLIFFSALYFDNPLIDIVFIFLAVLWIGPFLKNIGLITRKRFIIISSLMFCYDIAYVWLTPLEHEMSKVITNTSFTLGINVGMYFLGTADLLFANVLVSVVNGVKNKIIAATALVVSNMIFLYLAQAFDFFLVFPLLVLWVPVGLMLLFVFRGKATTD